jgi:amino acid adenylation domain-containing protein
MSRAVAQTISSLSIGESDIEDSYPLSPLQQGMLFHNLASTQPGVDVEQMLFEISGVIDSEAFRRAWERVIERHAVLRTSFHWEGLDEPVQVVHRNGCLQLCEEDWRLLSTVEWRLRLNQFLKEDRERGFDLTQSPLMRVALFSTESSNIFVWTFHHALLDGRSFVLVLHQLYDFYTSILNGAELHLEQPRPYREHIEWLSKLDIREHEEFWRGLLKGFSAPTHLPAKHDVDLIPHNDGAHSETCIRLSPEVTSSLKRTALECEVTLYTLVQAAWALLLSRYGGEPEVAFGVTRACRRTAAEGSESVVGLFINTLPIRISVPADKPLQGWLQEMRSQHIALRQHEHTPLPRILEWSEVPRAEPLFESILVFESYELPRLLENHWKEWIIQDYELFEHTNYPLSLSAWSGDQLRLKIEYDTHRFDAAIINRMLEHLETLLTGFVTGADQPVSTLPTLSEVERLQILAEWNDTGTEWPSIECVHKMFERQAERTPDAVALFFEESSMSYRELNRRSNRLAHYLGSLGVAPGSLIGISMKRSLDMIIALFGILKAGCAYVPLDPAYPKQRLAAMLNDARVSLLLTEQRVLENLPEAGARVVILDLEREIIDSHSADNPRCSVSPVSPAYVIYTSGSTGIPKGVMIEHRSLSNYVRSVAWEFGLAAGDRVLQFASISFDTSAEEIYPCLTTGAALGLRTDSMLNSTSTFLQACSEWSITILDLPTAYWHDLTSSLNDQTPSLFPASIRLVIIGGEQALAERVVEWHEQVPSRVRLVNTYGPTEATIVATFSDLTSLVQAGHPLLDVPVGRPMPNVQACILDHHDQLSPVGVNGELHLGGAGVAQGYLNRPSLTAEKFIPNPFEPGTRLYRTGDLARYLPDGKIQLAGRVDTQVKINGFRVEPGEIEAALRSSPYLTDAIVLAREDNPGERRLVAYGIRSREADSLSPTELTNELRGFLRHKLPTYMHPSVFVPLEVFPTSGTGKVDRKALPKPNPERAVADQKPDSARDPLERQLVEIWEEILGVHPIGIRDNFFDLGGHSLLSMRMIDKVERMCGKRVPFAVLFEEPTVEHLAASIAGQAADAEHRWIVTIQSGDKRPFFFLHGDYNGGGFYCSHLARGLGEDQPFYAVQPHGLDGGAIPQSIEAMAASHLEAVRSVQPKGPYLLGGYCNGAAVAFEVARRLRVQGERVDLLVLLGASAYVPNRIRILRGLINGLVRIRRLGPEESSRRLVLFLERIARLKALRNYYRSRFIDLYRMRAIESVSFLVQKSVSHATQLRVALRNALWRAKSAAMPPETSRQIARTHDRRERLNDAYRRALLGFVPKPYDGRVTVLWPSELKLGDATDPTAGWSKVAAEVEVKTVPGGHITCLTKNVNHLAQALKACIETTRQAISAPDKQRD